MASQKYTGIIPPGHPTGVTRWAISLGYTTRRTCPSFALKPRYPSDMDSWMLGINGMLARLMKASKSR